MAFASILRRSVTLGGSLVWSGQRNYHAALLFTAVSHQQACLSNQRSSLLAPFISNTHRFSTAVVDTTDTTKPSSTDSLLRVIESEIKVAEESDDRDRAEEVPEDFPFKMEDVPGKRTVVVTRDYDGEHVRVEVHMLDLVSGEDNDYDNDDDEYDQPTRSSLPLVVTVNKKSGTCLEFGCVAYPDSIEIDSLSVKNPETSEEQLAYEGPDFSDLDENLKKAFHTYLEIRGIKPSTTNFLHEYMINKDSREYLHWLKNLKDFVEA